MLQFKRLLFFSAAFILLLGLCTSVSADENKIAAVAASSLNLRSGPSTANAVIVTLKHGYKLTILETSNGWYKVKTPARTVGWVHSDYVTKTGTVASRGAVTRTQSKASSELSTEIVSYAKKFLGVKYVWGGNTPSGFDCSGFVKYVYNHFDLSIERVASAQAKQGTAVSKANLRAGDLVFFDTNGGHNKVNHVGMYIGDGKFIQSSSGSSAHKVVISNLESGFYNNSYMTARRFF
jgi:cell wall-associated NlpC family hydrolase